MFSVDDKGDLVLDKPECRRIRSFKALIARDKGGVVEGDSTGSKKYRAFAELLYIYLVYNPKSIFRALGEIERREKAKGFVGLPKEWKPDDKVKKAESTYIKGLELSATYKAYINAERSLYSIGEDIQLFNEQKLKICNRLIAVMDAIAGCTDKEKLKELRESEEIYTRQMMEATLNIQKLTEGLTKNFNIVEDLKKRVAAEDGKNKEEIRGGGSLGNREE